MCGFVRARISLAILRSNSLLLHGPHDKGARICQRPELTDGAVMALLALWRGSIEGIFKGMMGGDEVKDSIMVMEKSRCIARETSESTYIWDSERAEKTEIVDKSNSVE